jgi:hypothetical protein
MRDEILPGQYYLSATLRSFRIADVRVLTSKFYGTVHSYGEIQTGTGDIAQLQTVVTPQQLQGADPTHLDRTIVQDIPLLGPVPFLGGNFVIQVGLFSVKETDLASPYLNLLGAIANKAGISYLNEAVQLAQPILDGVNAIVDSSVGGLQIGLYKGFVQPEVPKQGYYAIIAAPNGEIDTSDLAIDNSERLVYFDTRKEIDAGYLVFTINRLTERTDWRQIPDLKQAYADLRASGKTRDKTKINDAFTAFKVTVDNCLDLLDADQTAVINSVQSEVNKLIASLGTSNPQPLPMLRDVSVS